MHCSITEWVRLLVGLQWGKDRSIQVFSGRMLPEVKEAYLSWNLAYFCHPPLRKIYFKYKRKWEKKRDDQRMYQRMIRECILHWHNKHWMRNSYMGLGSTQSKWTHAHTMKYVSEYFLLFLQIQESILKDKSGFVVVAVNTQNLKRKQIKNLH